MLRFAQIAAQHAPRHSAYGMPRGSSLWLAAVFALTLSLMLLSASLAFGAPWAGAVTLLAYDALLLGYTAHRIRRALSPAAQRSLLPAEKRVRPSITVIIAAHNEAAVLPEAIERLLDQHDLPEKILIADDGSTDNSDAILADRFALTAAPIGMVSEASRMVQTLHWLRLPHGGKARAVNRAVALAETEIVVVLDADTLLEHKAIGAMRDAFAAHDSIVAASGVMEPFTDTTMAGRAMHAFQANEYQRTALMSLAWQQDNALQLIAGAFAGFRRDALLAVGGFNPDCLVEDYDLAHRIHRYAVAEALSWTVAVVGEALSHTEAPATPLAFIQQRRRWFGGFLQIHWWNRDMIGNGRFGRLGKRLMVVKTFDAAQPFIGLAAAVGLGLAVASGRAAFVVPALTIVAARALLNFAWTLWSHRVYRAWTGQLPRRLSAAEAGVGTLEAWTYRMLRHVGEVWGWWQALRGRNDWSPASPKTETAQIDDGNYTYHPSPPLQASLGQSIADDV